MILHRGSRRRGTHRTYEDSSPRRTSAHRTQGSGHIPTTTTTAPWHPRRTPSMQRLRLYRGRRSLARTAPIGRLLVGLPFDCGGSRRLSRRSSRGLRLTLSLASIEHR